MKFELYRDDAGEWRWRFRAANGRILATGAEGYKNKGDCRAGLDLVRESRAEVVEVRG